MSLWTTLLPRRDPEQVVRAYATQVNRHLRRIFGPEADVDDVFQTVMLEILRSLPAFAGRAKLATWIRRITWNVAYQEMRLHYRRARFLPVEDTAAIADPAPGTDEQAFRALAHRRLYRALDALDPKQRMPVLMHDVEGMTLKEIGQALGRPLPTVASQLYAGRKELAAAMRDLSPSMFAESSRGESVGES